MTDQTNKEIRRHQLARLAKVLDGRLKVVNPFNCDHDKVSIDDRHYSLIEFAASGNQEARRMIVNTDMRPCLQRYYALIMDLTL